MTIFPRDAFPLLLSRLAFAVFLAPAPLLAAQPDAGVLLDSVKPPPSFSVPAAGAVPEAPLRPALKLDATVKIVVKEVGFRGNRAFSDAELMLLVSDIIGRELTLADLQGVVERITRHYQDAGYLLARAYLPAQDIKEGRIEIAVLEGRLGRLRIDNGSALSDESVSARLADIKEGLALEGKVLESSLLLINDLPGVEVKSTLRPGASVGTTDLDIRLVRRPPYSGSVELDNYGNRFTGDLRLGGSLAVANPIGLGDALSLRALTAEGMDYGRVAYQLPVNDRGTQLGAAWSDMNYRLGHDFSNLKAHGKAEIGSLYLLHPLRRSRSDNLNGQLSFDSKRLEDRMDATATVTGKTFQVWTLGLSGDHIDGLGGGGLMRWNATFVQGKLELDNVSRLLDELGHRTQGAYDKATLSLSRLQRLAGDLTFYVGAQGQWAGKNLDSAEKMVLGGAQAVRAYPQGEAPADDAWLVNLELRYALNATWQISLFHDVAEAYLNHAPILADTRNHRRLAGTGFGLEWVQAGDVSLQIGLARRNGPLPTSDVDQQTRGWVQLVKRF